MEILKTKILPFFALIILLFFITLSFKYNQFLFTEILICSLIVGCLILMKTQSKVKRTSSSTRENINNKVTKKELSNAYSEQYS